MESAELNRFGFNKRRVLGAGFTVVFLSSVCFGTALPPLLAKVEQKYRTAKTLSARFVQRNEIAAFDRVRTSKGTVFVQRPDKIRWETSEPEKTTLVTNGKKFYFYTPPFDEDDRGQLVIRNVEQAQSRLARTLIAGEFSLAKGMVIKALSANRFSLTPSSRKVFSGVERAELTIDPSSLLIKEVLLKHRGGNVSRVSLFGVKLGVRLGAGIFKFKTPPKTDVVKE